mmetsp:Transcript_9104/g.20519  ORF Transcript_9104/g.20519 Transcript_9104/m.20519 type:complete len:286 (-) Transcript_9104:107-964(-)
MGQPRGCGCDPGNAGLGRASAGPVAGRPRPPGPRLHATRPPQAGAREAARDSAASARFRSPVPAAVAPHRARHQAALPPTPRLPSRPQGPPARPKWRRRRPVCGGRGATRWPGFERSRPDQRHLRPLHQAGHGSPQGHGRGPRARLALRHGRCPRCAQRGARPRSLLAPGGGGGGGGGPAGRRGSAGRGDRRGGPPELPARAPRERGPTSRARPPQRRRVCAPLQRPRGGGRRGPPPAPRRPHGLGKYKPVQQSGRLSRGLSCFGKSLFYEGPRCLAFLCHMVPC